MIAWGKLQIWESLLLLFVFFPLQTMSLLPITNPYVHAQKLSFGNACKIIFLKQIGCKKFFPHQLSQMKCIG